MPAPCGSVSIVCSIACLGRDACLVDHIDNQSHKSQSEQVTKNGPYLLSGSKKNLQVPHISIKAFIRNYLQQSQN